MCVYYPPWLTLLHVTAVCWFPDITDKGSDLCLFTAALFLCLQSSEDVWVLSTLYELVFLQEALKRLDWQAEDLAAQSKEGIVSQHLIVFMVRLAVQGGRGGGRGRDGGKEGGREPIGLCWQVWVWLFVNDIHTS